MNPTNPRSAAPLPSPGAHATETSCPSGPVAPVAWAEDCPPSAETDPLVGWLDGGQAVLDPNGRITSLNDALCHWFDGTPGELIGHSFWSRLAGRCAGDQKVVDALRFGTGVFAQARVKSPVTGDAAAHWYQLDLARHESGAVVSLHSILPPLAELADSHWNHHLRPASAQREMFVRLLRAEAQLESLTDRWPGVIFSQRADFTFRFVSPKILDLTGVPAHAWEGKPNLFWNFVHEADAGELRQSLQQARLSRQPVTSTYRIRNVQTGRVSYVLEHRQTLVSAGGLVLGYEGVWLDTTRQTIAERRLARASWKETLSVLTMSLSHDFGNAMAGIHGLSEAFLEELGPRHPHSESLALIRENARQASLLVQRIVNLHAGKAGETHYHNLNDLAADLADLVRKIIPRRMQLAVELSPEALPVYLDAFELRQVVLDLVLNAIEASPPTGRLVLRTAFHETLPARPCLHGGPPRLPAVSFSVQDTGSGIPARHLANLFDAFFTTKPMSKSAGLGLYNARAFVEKHRGAISVDTAEGTGSTFQLWLPQADFTEAERGENSGGAHPGNLNP